MSIDTEGYLFVVDPQQARHIREIAPALKGHKVYVHTNRIQTLAELKVFINKIESAKLVTIKGIILSYSTILRRLIAEKFNNPLKFGTDDAVSTNYQGAMFSKKIGGKDYPVVILPELKSFVYKNTAEFLTKRFCSKLWDNKFPSAPELTWELLSIDNVDKYYNMFKSAIIMGGDIETSLHSVSAEFTKDPKHEGMWLETYKRNKDGTKSKYKITAVPKITMQGYTGIFKTADGKWESTTIVIKMDHPKALEWLRKFNALPAIKIYQNGKYDIAYHLRYAAPMENYVYDTLMMMHSWYAELPKKLEFISAMMLKNHMYWKDESGINMEFYNAQDCHNMTWACLFMLQEMPDWAKANYKENFPKIFPAISANLTGMKVDQAELAKNLETAEKELEEAKLKLSKMTGMAHFNAASAKQVVGLMSVLGTAAKSSDKVSLTNFSDKSELNSIYVDAINLIRLKTKAIGNYFTPTLFNGRFLYSVDPAGTETGRCACRESEFWCGGNLQNQPAYAKSQYIPDEGYLLGAVDYSQSESRCTAYMSEDLNLIDAVENAEDFHVKNAAQFFGMSEEYILSLKTKNPDLYKKLRNRIGKKINHGANYNMGPQILANNMGAKAVIEAAHTLKLPAHLTIHQICAYLLNLFDKTYPKIRNLKDPDSYYSKVIQEIEETRMLVGPTGWTRYCFGDPRTKKLDLNSYVAHGPQSLSVKKINDAWFKCWKKLQIEENKAIFLPQIHDELLFMYKPENEDYVFDRITNIMSEPTVVNGRIMIIPSDSSKGAKNWLETK